MFVTSRPVCWAYRSTISSAQAAGLFGRPDDVEVKRFGIGCLGPVGERRSQIHERISNRGHFPVEESHNVGQVGRIENEVVEFEVVVNQARPGRLGRPMSRPATRPAVQRRNLVRAGVLIALIQPVT